MKTQLLVQLSDPHIRRCSASSAAICTTPSTAHQVCPDLVPDAASRFALEPPGFLIHAWSEAGPPVTHQAAIGEFNGPHPFYDEKARLID
jgi:3',5'-cyclic-AMP phosphodiesterase